MRRLLGHCGCRWFACVCVLWCLASSVGSTWPVGSSGFQDVPLSAQEIQLETNKSDRGLTSKQRRELLKNNFEKMKKDADELADLAKSLQDDLNKSSEHVLSLQIMEKAEKIEKLARKIKSTAKGY